MSKEFEKKLFTETEEFFLSRGTKVFYDDVDGINVLVMEYDDDNAPADCNVSVIDLNDDCTAINIMFTLVSASVGKAYDEIESLLPNMNLFLTIGSFGLIKETGYLFFNCSMIVDENADITQTMKLFLSTWEAAYDTARQGIDILLPVINGDVDASGLSEDDVTIIQF